MSGGFSVVDTNTPINGFGTEWDQHHEGHQGWRADEILGGRWGGEGTLSEWAPAHDPHVVVINLGANDIIQNQSGAIIIGEIQTIIAVLRANNPQVDIVVMTLIDLVHDMNLGAQGDVDELNELIRVLPELNTPNSRVVLADVAVGFNGATMNTDDGIHPNATGAQHMAEIVRASIVDNGLVATGTGNQDPVAVFTSSCTDATCSFNGTASNDPDGTVASWAWNFGDGTTETGTSTSRTYVASGPFNVTLTVTDDMGATHATSASVSPSISNSSPTAAYTHSCSGASCTFTTTSTDVDGSIASWSWNFGDAGTSTAPNPVHVYSAGGIYTVTLTVTDNLGASTPTSGAPTRFS